MTFRAHGNGDKMHFLNWHSLRLFSGQVTNAFFICILYIFLEGISLNNPSLAPSRYYNNFFDVLFMLNALLSIICRAVAITLNLKVPKIQFNP
jgi:hypothetical protein